MEIHVTQTSAGTTFCNRPFVEQIVLYNSHGGLSSSTLEVTPAEMVKITDPTLQNTLVDGELSFSPIEIIRTDEEKRRDELKQKAIDGTLAGDELIEALKFLL